MKKIAIGLLGLSLVLTLGGCGQKKPEVPASTPEAEGEVKEELTVYTFEESCSAMKAMRNEKAVPRSASVIRSIRKKIRCSP